MAPTVIQTFGQLTARFKPFIPADASDLGQLEQAKHVLAARDSNPDSTPKVNPSHGVLDPHDISNVGFFVLFAVIGLAFVITGIWFFFWAKNGGFHFKDSDWEDYKTAVLRRRGPNGTLLSGATAPTNLGGGSVYKDVDDDGRTTITDSTGLSGITAGASDIVAREKRDAKREQRRREREERRRKEGRRTVGDEGVVTDEFAEKKAQQELRSYRHEKPARVGGLNREADGSDWDASTNPTASTVDSELLSNRQTTPTTTPTKTRGGIRKVYSTAERETERIRDAAKRQREERSSGRRDFSFQRAGAGDSLLEEENMVGGDDGDLGTKSYHHPRPELREQRRQEREERRARRGGYRRGRGDDDDI